MHNSNNFFNELINDFENWSDVKTYLNSKKDTVKDRFNETSLSKKLGDYDIFKETDKAVKEKFGKDIKDMTAEEMVRNYKEIIGIIDDVAGKAADIITKNKFKFEATPKATSEDGVYSFKAVMNEDDSDNGNIGELTMSTNDSRFKDFVESVAGDFSTDPAWKIYDVKNLEIKDKDSDETILNVPVNVEVNEFPKLETETEIKSDKYFMDDFQIELRYTYTNAEALERSTYKTCKEAMKDGYYVEFANGAIGMWTAYDSYGEDEDEGWSVFGYNYWFENSNFTENGECTLDVEDKEAWNIVKVFGDTVNPFHMFDGEYKPVLWEKKERTSYTYDELKEILGGDFEILN